MADHGLSDQIDRVIADLTPHAARLSGLIALIAELTAKLPGVKRAERDVLAARHGAIDREIRALAGRPDGAAATGGGRFSGGQTVGQRREQIHRDRDALNRQIAALDQRDRASRPIVADTTYRPPAVSVRRPVSGATASPSVAGPSAQDLEDQRAAADALRVIDQARLDLARARGEVEERSAFIARQLASDDLRGATAEQRADLESMLGTLYDIDAAQRNLAAVDQSITDQTALRAALLDRIETLEAGGFPGAEALRGELERVNTTLAATIDQYIELLTLQGGPASQAAILRLQQQKDGLTDVGRKADDAGSAMQAAFGQGIMRGWDGFIDRLAETGKLFSSLRDAFLDFAADFLRQIGQMIVQAQVLKLVQAIGNSQGGVGGFLGSLFKVGTAHTGGIVGGSGGGSKWVNPAVFAGAARYHFGGLVSGEVPIIAKRNEEVLTESDPRHRFNGGGAGASIKVVNLFDHADFIDKALTTETGERAVVNVIRANASAIKAVLS